MIAPDRKSNSLFEAGMYNTIFTGNINIVPRPSNDTWENQDGLVEYYVM